ncbi:hypothetical protein ACJ4V0_15770 [Phreatobacter sp. HK31-P]
MAHSFIKTLADFAATGRDEADLGAALQEDTLPGVPGRLYVDVLYLEKTATGWSLLIGREYEESPDIAALESGLFEFALDEGYVDDWNRNASEARHGAGTEAALIDELEAFAAVHGLALQSADKMLAEINAPAPPFPVLRADEPLAEIKFAAVHRLTPRPTRADSHRAWLGDFIIRWGDWKATAAAARKGA